MPGPAPSGPGRLPANTMATDTTIPVKTDERVAGVGLFSRLLARPDTGAFIGAVAVFLLFSYYARGHRLGRRHLELRGLDRPGGAVRHRRRPRRTPHDRR